jgi:hypothetical protein
VTLRISLRNAQDEEVAGVMAENETEALKEALVLLSSQGQFRAGDALLCWGEEMENTVLAETLRAATHLERRALATTNVHDMKAAALPRLFADTIAKHAATDDIESPPRTTN